MNKLTVNRILGLPKTIYFNFKYLPLKQARKLPIRLGPKVKLEIDKEAHIVLESEEIYPGLIQIGIGYGSHRRTEKSMSYINIRKGGTLTFQGKAMFQRGTFIQIEEGAKINIGKSFSANHNFLITTDSNIDIGENVLLGWDVSLLGTDGHDILDLKTGQVINGPKAITIHDQVWVCSQCSLLKGAEVAEGSIVGFGSLVKRRFTTPNTLITGSPAEEKAYNKEWRY